MEPLNPINEETPVVTPCRVYKEEYKKFLDTYQSGTTSAEQVGLMIARLSQYFSDANDTFGVSKRGYNSVLNNIELEVDDKGKAISTAKATSRAAASTEGGILIDAEIDIKNLDNNINALKSLQKGILLEWQHSGNM